MSTVIVVAVLLVSCAAGYRARSQNRRRHLRERFGPEYDRAVRTHARIRDAERELLARERRHDRLGVHDLDPVARARHRAAWQEVQERFVDAPADAAAEADRLLVRVMCERGYPAEGYEQRVADLSVRHARTVDQYRAAHVTALRAKAGKASTEDLRQAMVQYRRLFNELLEADAETPHDGRAQAEYPRTHHHIETADEGGRQ
jgi:hypothetical protein